MCSMGLWKMHSVIGTKASGPSQTKYSRHCQHDLPTTLHTLTAEGIYLRHTPRAEISQSKASK